MQGIKTFEQWEKTAKGSCLNGGICLPVQNNPECIVCYEDYVEACITGCHKGG